MAWCRIQLANELINAGHREEGEHEIDRALFYFPDYHLALAAKGHARLAAGDMNAAIDFYRRAVTRAPLPDYSAILGDIYTKLGRTEDAKREYELVDFVERTGAMDGTYARQLALFWADHNIHLDEALAAAQKERAIRSDVFTCDVLAWCLFKTGRLEDAKRAMDEAMRTGARDARFFYHAGMIANKLGDKQSARIYLAKALEISPVFDVLQADVARDALLKLNR